MQKRETLKLKDAYYDFDDPIHVEGYEERSFGVNRGDSIEWARQRCQDDDEINALIFDLRRQFRERLIKDFPNEAASAAILEDDQDPTTSLSMSATWLTRGTTRL